MWCTKRGEGGCVRQRHCENEWFGCPSAAVCTSIIQVDPQKLVHERDNFINILGQKLS